ncbi:MAG: sugar ABC transporter ATP-binding protein [Solirubrobacterales bacterium]|nr:sugar ABC transporter ATP-binding protein [Solirubrobacterales bacterium]
MKGVDLTVERRTVHGIVGANGAGKSTLFKIIAGALEPTSGEIRWKGELVEWSSPAAPLAAGISTIYQHIPLVPALSVLENVFLGDFRGLYARGRLLRRYRAVVERVEYDLDPDLRVSDLSIGQRQMVAIMHALAHGAELVIMDEPTASLAQGERELVFETVRRLRDRENVTFIYCSHFLDEVLSLTDIVTVVRDGLVVAHEPTAGFSEDRLVVAMVGKQLASLESRRQRESRENAPVLLEVDRLESPGRISDVSLAVHEGEIVGLAGLLGSGRSEILHAIFGSDTTAKGRVALRGRELSRSARANVRSGLALVPEERMRQGLVPDWEIWRNTSLPDLTDLSAGGLLPSRAREVARAERAIRDLRIVTRSADAPVSALSGGNAQKVVFAKWLYGGASVFLLDEPTVGVDVETKAEILELIRRFALEGKGAIVASSEFEELLAVAHRILVVSRGRIVAERRASETSEEELLTLASGLGIKEGVA